MESVYSASGSTPSILTPEIQSPSGPAPTLPYLSTYPNYRLSSEIASFSQMIGFFQQTGDREKRLWAIKAVNRLVKAAPFGSFKYGIYLPWHADLDLVVSDRDFLVDPEKSLTDLAAKLPGVIGQPNVVSKGRVPFLAVWLLRRQDEKCAVCLRENSLRRCPAHSPLLVQISLKTEAHKGIVTSNYVMNLLRSMPVVRPLVQVLKHFLVKAGLNEAFNGGLSSYSVILLVVAFLRTPHALSGGGDLGGIVLNLVRFYVEEFDAEKLALTPGEVASYRPRRESEKGELMVVLDPLDVGSNAARSFWRFPEFKACLTDALEALRSGSWWRDFSLAIHQHGGEDTSYALD
jgi:hypothetical protein